VLPSYVPARDHIDAVEQYYANLALRNLLQDIEDSEARDRRRVMEEQRIGFSVLEEKHASMRALRAEEAKLERLAALDAEAMLRAHMSKVQRGAIHREHVVDELLATTTERERSPDGRRARILLETSRSPVRASRLGSDASHRGNAVELEQAVWTNSTHRTTIKPSAPTPATAAAAASPVLPPVPQAASPFLTPAVAQGTSGRRAPQAPEAHPSAAAAVPRGGDAASRTIDHDEDVAYASARRRYKKMLMEQALR
jgi:hypothetical protein